jgi:uncharacterized membrane protein
MSETIKSTATDAVEAVEEKTKKKINLRKPKLPTKQTLKTIGITAAVTTVAIVVGQSKSKKTLTVDASTSDIVDDSDETSN